MILGIATADTKDSTIYTLEQSGLSEMFDYVGYSDGDIEPKPARTAQCILRTVWH
ncbi:HAD family hydrolase [Vibrio lentus]|nr:HAD family hydrolase [Vibrio lentus]